jgi:hypothetical protein
MANKDDIISELRAVVDALKRQTETQAQRIAELELQLNRLSILHRRPCLTEDDYAAL